MPRFDYPCPGCRTTNSLHDADCRFEGTQWPTVEKAYVDIVSLLSVAPRTEDSLSDLSHGEWDNLHTAALEYLKRQQRVVEEDGALRLLTAAEYKELVSEPTREPMRTLYLKGSVPGCHDNAVFAMVAWYEMVGLSWAETKEHVVEWLHDSGSWDRGGFEEATPEQLVESKRHVYEAGYGWKEKAQAAKRVIDRSV
ncbi:hypothetical protein SAMN04487950_3211 [Halogranum rubrum]|uniref:Uncharacterized protein n=2 Tax=Halogranum rubrum TaxID=553466 RepID=A0A1I4GD45_9EURY|nr:MULTISPECIES: hypothetical protein [Halogranum]EJN59756.1 hypothetical protein HSB1_19140 [Halogranum salarium B-1]SFL27955.1 hypothetical protein SAMN04487950_3211 [Halogranum rubrum]